MAILPIKGGEKIKILREMQKNMRLGIADSKTLLTFALAKTKWEVLYGQLLVNPPGLDRSKGSRS